MRCFLPLILITAYILNVGCASTQVASRDPQSDEMTPPLPAKFAADQIQHRGSGDVEFDWPVDQARLTRGYFLKDPRHRTKRKHLGIDLAAPRGTPIYSSHKGTVIYVGRDFKGYGRMIMIEGRNHWATLYAHLVGTHVKEGQIVQQGDLIGDMGRSGHATGVHLHFEIRKETGPVDPLEYLPMTAKYSASQSRN